MKTKFAFLFSLLIAALPLGAQTARDYAVPLSAEIQKDPARITLHWASDAGSNSYLIWRKKKTDANWGTSLASLQGTATTWADNDISLGEAYEYKIEKTAINSAYKGYGYIFAGIEVPPVENRNKIILLIDDDFTDALATEINRLQMDITGDGWQVIKHYINKNGDVKDVKKYIKTVYDQDSDGVKAVFLLGHIPVPYSGDYAIDGHIPDHYGAWPADVYYADMNENGWSDFFVDDEMASRAQNHNIPEDGKFDNDIIPSALELQIGRVDFYDMPAFKLSETELMRRYLDKDHNWRVKNFTAKEKAVVEDNFGGMNGEAFAASGYYNFSPMFGDSNVFTQDYLTSVSQDTFLWSYGAGGGYYNSAAGIATTAEFSAAKINTVFTMLFGSYFGDWNSQNNFLRAPLAADGMALTNVWSGRPHWNFHHMALGENIGYSAWISQNDYTNYFRLVHENFTVFQNPEDRLVTPALMGDPTLRMHVISPPANLKIQAIKDEVKLQWSKSTDNVAGYYIYKTTDLQQPYTRLAAIAASDTSFTDRSPHGEGGKTYYMVRAMKLQTSASGSYFNLSQGILDSVTLAAAIAETAFQSTFKIFPNPSQTGNFNIRFKNILKDDIILQLTDVTGRALYTRKLYANAGADFHISIQSFPKGIYILKLSNNSGIAAQKIVYK